MRFLGMALVMLAALWFSRSFAAYVRRRVEECEGYLALFTFMRGEINCHLRPVSAWCREFSDPALVASGFLPALTATGSLSGAWETCARASVLPEEGRRILSAYFSSFGRWYREDELKLLEYYTGEWDRLLAKIKQEAPRSIRLLRTPCASAANAAVILLL